MNLKVNSKNNRELGIKIKDVKKIISVLHESEERYRTLVEFYPEGFCVLIHGRIKYVNPVGIKLLGAKELKDVFDKKIIEFVCPKDRKLVVSSLKDAEENKTFFPAEIQAKRINGKDSYFKVVAGHINYNGKKAIMAIFRDISERKIMENQLRASNELLEKVFSTTNVLLVYLDRSFNFVRVNRAYAELEGSDPKYFVGRNYFDLFPNREDKKIFKNVIDTGRTYSDFNRPFVYRDQPERGTTYWDWVIQATKDENGKVTGILASFTNVTEHFKAEEKLLESYKHLGVVNRQISILLDLNKQSGGEKTDEIIQYVVNSATNISQANTIAFFKYEEDKNVLLLNYSNGLNKKELKCLSRISVTQESLLKTLVTNKTRLQGLCRNGTFAELGFNTKLQYCLFLPLITNNKLTGVLFLGFRNRDTITTQELDFFEAFASQASFVLQKLGL